MVKMEGRARQNNTVKYSLAGRHRAADPGLLSSANNDDDRSVFLLKPQPDTTRALVGSRKGI